MSASDKLSSYLPEFLGQSVLLQSVYYSHGSEIDSISEAVDDVMNQLFIDTATWGLDFWEEFTGISTDTGKSNEDRREAIKLKIIGVGTLTKSKLRNIVVTNSPETGDAEIIENHSINQVIVKIINRLPNNVDNLKEQVTGLKPAHIQVDYTYKSLPIMDVDKLSISEIEKSAVGDLE